MMTWEEGLLKICEGLSVQDRGAVLSFAGYLANQSGAKGKIADIAIAAQEPEVLAVPEVIARPDDESSVAALKRLSATYSMLDKNILLEKTSSLMISHIMQGRDKKDVIDELEQIFSDEYEILKIQMEEK